MSKELDAVFDEISKWSVDDIESVMFHEKWTKEGTEPFNKLTKSKTPPPKPPKSFKDCREKLKPLLEQELDGFNSEEKAKLIICSTFLLMNDKKTVRHDYLARLLEDGQVQTNLLRLLNEMDNETPEGNIKKLQLFYALNEQRYNPHKIKIQKVTWSNVTSRWGPKVVMSDDVKVKNGDDENYRYIFNDLDGFEERFDNYKTAAKIGKTEQYRSDYNLINKEELNLKIIEVLATQGCLTLAEHFENEKLGHGGSKKSSKLFDKLSQEYFRNDLNTQLSASSESLRNILPRLTEESNLDNCVESILNDKKQWLIPRTIIKYDNQSWFFIHGDEWGGNFLVAENADRVYVIDFEDAIFSNANEPDKIIRVGGDLSSRIYSPGKDEDKEFAPIGLSLFASIGRLLAAIVQYHSRWFELRTDMIGIILDEYLDSFEKSLSSKNDKGSIICEDYWNSDLKPLILLHAWDWALYWEQKPDSRFPQKHYEKFIEEIKKLLGCEEISTDFNRNIKGPNSPTKGNIPRLSESQYNIFNDSMFHLIPPFKGEITDKIFEVHLKNLQRKNDIDDRLEYTKKYLLPFSQKNRELEYFSLLYTILNSPYSEAKNHYNRVREIAEELSRESGDSGYLYVSQLSLFNSASHYQDPGELYNDMIYMPEDRTTFYVVSRFYLSNYHMSKGDYPTALDFNIEGDRHLSEIPGVEEVALWWSLYNTRCFLYLNTGNEEKLNSIIVKLVGIFQDIILALEENVVFCNSVQFYTILGEINDYENQKTLLEYFNKPEFKDELLEENLARLYFWNAQNYSRNEEFTEAIQAIEMALPYTTDPLLRCTLICHLAGVYSKLERFEKAIHYFKQAMELDYRELEFWRIYHQLAYCYIETEDYVNAIKYTKKCAEVNHELYLSNSLPEHFHIFLQCSKDELMLGFNRFKEQYHRSEVFSQLGELLNKGIREFKKTSFEDKFCEEILIQLREICTICSRIDPQFYSNQLNRIEREWENKQRKASYNIDKTRFEREITLSLSERNTGAWSKAIERLSKVVDGAKSNKMYTVCARALKEIGTCYFEQKKYVKSQEFYDDAMDIYCQINDREGEVDVLMNLALIACERKRNLDADAKFDKCIEIYTSLGQDIGIADVHINRADIEILENNYVKAREYIQIALEIMRDKIGNNHFQKLATALNVSAILYSISKEFELSISELDNAYSLSKRINDTKGISDMQHNLGKVHMEYGRFLKLENKSELSKQQFQDSEKWFREHLKKVSEMEEAPADWFIKNGFFEDSKHWVEFPPDTSPDWL